MLSDLWAFGCIFYELIFGQKPFPSDWHVGQLAQNRRPLILPTLPFPVNERLACFISQFLYRLLEPDWWKRPVAAEVVRVLESINDDTTEFYEVDPKAKSFIERVGIYPDSQRWKRAEWRLCWYIINYLSILIAAWHVNRKSSMKSFIGGLTPAHLHHQMVENWWLNRRHRIFVNAKKLLGSCQAGCSLARRIRNDQMHTAVVKGVKEGLHRGRMKAGSGCIITKGTRGGIQKRIQ
jgi:serine/threonine protein kinase